MPARRLPAAIPVRRFLYCPGFVLILLLASPLQGRVIAQQPPSEAVAADLWTSQVAPLFQQHCFSCHGPESQESGLRLDTLEGLNSGGHSGPPVIPGQPEESLLLVAVRKVDSSLQMPPEGRLTPEQIRILENWIQQGAVHSQGAVQPAVAPVPFDPREAAKFWSLRPLSRPPVPDISGANIRTPIDAFITNQLQQKGLHQNAAADRLTLLRRASSQLTGLPPSPGQIEEFLADTSPEAFDRAVDRLLASPQYGERWARHWLDVVRYADSNGLDENIAHGNAWRYRNYVIDSFNADKPFNQFLREQLAGDLLTADQPDASTLHQRLIATGFLSLGPKVLAEGDERKLHLDIIDEQLDTIGRSMLGLTIGCARCHDHKFDPISQADYYSLAGIFLSTKTMESLKRIAKWNENSIATDADRAALTAHQERIASKKAEVAAFLASASASTGQPIPEDQLNADQKSRLQQLRDELKSLEASVPELPTAMGVVEGSIDSARILPRGNHLAPGRRVPRGLPMVLDPDRNLQIPDNHSGRLELANWIAGPSNSLTPRVIVNRVWRWHFGRGLSASTDNFGKLGEPPLHPELLDWLAAEFIDSGWSLKALHKLIIHSHTWQLASGRDNPAAEIDPDNHLHWRWTVQRLEAEAVRDFVLSACGQLDPTMGQSMLHVKNREFLFDHTSKDGTRYNSFRRSIYLPVIRNNLYDAMSLFDCTDGAVPNGDRGSSTVASQALFLMNSPLVLQAAEHLARQLLDESPEFAVRADRLLLRTLGRPATPADIQHLQQAAERLTLHLQQEAPAANHEAAVWTNLCQTLLMSNEFLYIR
jgi:mono/diheme cytochrome c family protein